MSAVSETTTTTESPRVAETVVLIDLSSIAHPLFHMSASDPDPNRTSIDTVAKVRALAAGQRHVAVCCDAPPYFRKDVSPDYKANRPESDATLQHQITLARETLVGDGFPVWAVRGFEADDLIGTATKLALDAGFDVLIASSDKDLLQLVGPHVKAKSLRDGAVIDTEAVAAKFGVRPDQIRDYLSLVGDTSDNVKGATGIGPKGAIRLLLKHNSLDELYARLDAGEAEALGLKPSEFTALAEFKTRYPTVRSLIALRDDVPIPFSEIMAERMPKDAATFGLDEMMEEEMDTLVKETLESAANVDALGVLREAAGMPAEFVALPAETNGETKAPVREPAALAVRDEQTIDAIPADWERQLDPRSMRDAKTLATDMFASRLFSNYGTPQGVLSTVMVGRELGLPAMTSLRSIHVIEGRHALSAALMVALVLKSGMAEYFEPISFSETEATFETKRKGARNAVRLTHTIEMAKTAGLVKEKSNWLKVPTDMLVARAQARLARMVYPDLMAGLYSPEELAERDNGNG